MRLACVAVAAVGACGFHTPDAPSDAMIDGAGSDAIDGMVDTGHIDLLPVSEESVGTVDWSLGVVTVIQTDDLTITPAAPTGITVSVGTQDNGGEVAIVR